MLDQGGVSMSLRQNYVTILSRILPAGAVGVSVLLGAAAPGGASGHPAASQPSAADEDRVSERLAAIREAVSTVAEEGRGANPADGNTQLAWGNWWNNFGWYRPWGWPNWNNWRNWNNWNNWWHNW
jgi:hypothetical protein